MTLEEKNKIAEKKALELELKKKEDTAGNYLLTGRTKFFQGDLEGALREYSMIVAFYPEMIQSQEALFMIGLIHAHSENPRKDFNNSVEFMKKLMRDHPQSLFAQQAKAWVGILQLNEKLIKENDKHIKENEKISKENERLLREQEKLARTLEEYKKVDIEIEGKKREKGR
ncbi:MAG: hypothetical protein AB1585_01955 [Thermodesulfobacteriota bacterium]